MKKTLFIDRNSTRKDFEQLYMLNVGDVFKIAEDDFETIAQRIEDYAPENLEFEFYPITPGTKLYTLYGSEHCIVTKKSIGR